MEETNNNVYTVSYSNATGTIPDGGSVTVQVTNSRDATPTESVEPTPTKSVEPTPTRSVEPTPTKSVEPTPTKSVEPTTEPWPNLGDLIISKIVTGSAGNQSQEFNFIVMLSDTSINGTYGDITFHDGVASFVLKHGERKIVTGLPAGIHYSVTELSAEQAGYAVTSMNAEGIISSSQSAEALFINAREEADVPQTGDNSHLEQWITMAILALLGMAASIFILRKDLTDRKRIR